MMKEIDYKKLRDNILGELVCQRMLDCKDNRTDMIRQLELDDQGKHIRKPDVYKWNGEFMIGLDLVESDKLREIGRLVEKGQSRFSHYSMGRVYYLSKSNIIL